MAEPTPLKHHEVVGYIVLVWQPGMGWQDNWDGEVHATYEDALRSADEYDGEDIIVTEARYVATADPAKAIEVTERQKCDLCDEPYQTAGYGYQLCREHADQHHLLERIIWMLQTHAAGGPIAQTCPRRYEMFQQGGAEGQDLWRLGYGLASPSSYPLWTCSYCGGVKPDQVIDLIKTQHWSVHATDKPYKAYIDDDQGHHVAKLYVPHCSTAQIDFLNSVVER